MISSGSTLVLTSDQIKAYVSTNVWSDHGLL